MSSEATVVCIRGPSGAGKTSLAEMLAPLLTNAGLCTGFVKRAHHLLDTPGKDSDRMVHAGASVLLHDPLGTILFRRPRADLRSLVHLLPPAIDVVLVETFRPERFPVLLAASEALVEGEVLLARFDKDTMRDPAALQALAELITTLHHARRQAANEPIAVARPHRCAGAILGRRLARYAAGLLGLEVPRTDRRLAVLCENDGCAADAVAAATGCRPGDRTLRFVYYGKMAATFTDRETGQAVRVWAAGDCRAIARLMYPDMEPHLAQQLAYAQLPDTELFRYRLVEPPALPGPRRRHLLCATCEEEVDGDAAVRLGEMAYCHPCAQAWRAGRLPLKEGMS